jgi:hypothetical protein
MCQLKRSMPCDDLMSLEEAGCGSLQEEAIRFLDESSGALLQQSRNKRQCFSFDRPSENPATAALEAALSMDDAKAVNFKPDMIAFSLLHSWASDLSLHHHDYIPCPNQMKTGSIPSSHSVNEVAGMMSKMTTVSIA